MFLPGFRHCVRCLVPVLGLAVLASPAAAQETPLQSGPAVPGRIRICADPDNMPVSNRLGQGFENRIAELLGKAWNAKVEYAWWPVRRGFFSRALNGGYCDVAITAPSELDMAAVTRPYFRSTYVVVSREDRDLDIRSLDDPRLKTLKIGIHLLNSDAENTPPAMAMSAHGVVGNLVGFGTFYAEGGSRPEDIIQAVANQDIDVAIVWGPLAGYFAKQSPVPLRVVPLPAVDSASGLPFAFNLSMAVRRRDRDLRDSLQKFLDAHGGEVEAILASFGVPLVPIPADSAKRVGVRH